MSKQLQFVLFRIAFWGLILLSYSNSYGQLTTLGVETPQECPPSVNSNIIFNYTLYLPDNYNDVEKVPVYIHLHGNNNQGASVEDFVMKGTYKVGKLYRDNMPYLVIRPRTAGIWNFEEVSKLLDHVMDTYKTDPDRVYLSGYSFGGRGTWDLLAYELSQGRNRFAAIASTAPASSGAFNINEVMQDYPELPIWLIHGNRDGLVSPNSSRSYAENAVRAGSEAMLTILPEKGHNVWGHEFDQPGYFEWVDAQTKTDKTPPKSKALSINFVNTQNADEQITAGFGVHKLGSVMYNWNNLSNENSSSLILSDASESGVQLSIENAESKDFDGVSATALEAGLSLAPNVDTDLKVKLSNISSDFNGQYMAIVYLTGERPTYAYDNWNKDEDGDYIYNQLSTGNTSASISDGSTTYHYQSPDIFGGPSIDLYPYMLSKATSTTSQSEQQEATYAVFGPYENVDELTFTLSNVEGGDAGIGGIQLVSLSNEPAFSPAKAQFDLQPTVLGENAVYMSAIATLASKGAVEYNFVCLENEAFSSGWQSDINFEFHGLTANTTYTYQLQVRDKEGNQPSPSENFAITTLPDNTLKTIAWHSFNRGLLEIKSDLMITDFTANVKLYDIRQFAATFNSNDGTYGENEIPLAGDHVGAIKLTAQNNSNKKFDLYFKNETGVAMDILGLNFDFIRNSNDAPKNLKVTYLNGDLDDSDNTELYSFTNNTGNIGGNFGNFADVNTDLTSILSDYRLENGEEMTIRFEVDDAAQKYLAVNIDNISLDVRSANDGGEIAVTDVEITQGNLTLELEDEVTLNADVKPSLATNKNITWSSSQPEVASITQEGVVKALNIGETVITVTTEDGGYTSSITIQVKDALVITKEEKLVAWHTFNEDNLTFAPTSSVEELEGQIKIFHINQLQDESGSADGNYGTIDFMDEITTENALRVVTGNSNNDHFTVTLRNTSEKDIELKTLHFDYSRVATTSPKDLLVTYLEGSLSIEEGTEIFTLKDHTEGVFGLRGNFVDVDITLSDVFEDITLAPQEYITINFKAENAENQWIPLLIDNIAFISDVLSIEEPEEPKVIDVTAIQINENNLTLKEGEEATLSATVSPENATNKNHTWASSSPSIVSVDANGNINAITEGEAEITVTSVDGGFTSSITITVKKVVEVIHVTSIEIDQDNQTLKVNEQFALSSTVYPENASNKNHTWVSSDPNVVSIDQNGNINAITEGEAEITVTSVDGGFTSSITITVEREEDVTSLKEDLLELKIYPNPAQQQVNIQTDYPVQSVMVSNLQGQLIEKEVTNGILSIGDLSNGLYFIMVEGYQPKKLMIRK